MNYDTTTDASGMQAGLGEQYYYDSYVTTAPQKNFTMEKTVDKPDEYYVKGDQIIF